MSYKFDNELHHLTEIDWESLYKCTMSLCVLYEVKLLEVHFL